MDVIVVNLETIYKTSFNFLSREQDTSVFWYRDESDDNVCHIQISNK